MCRDELLTFLGLVTMMGLKKLSIIENYCSESLNFVVSYTIHVISQILADLHVVDNSILSGNGPVLDVLSRTFLSNCSWASEASPTLGCSIKISCDICICYSMGRSDIRDIFHEL